MDNTGWSINHRPLVKLVLFVGRNSTAQEVSTYLLQTRKLVTSTMMLSCHLLKYICESPSRELRATINQLAYLSQCLPCPGQQLYGQQS